MAVHSSTRTGRSCSTCPAFLQGAEQTRVLGSNLSGPLCGLKMLPLIMPTQGAETGKKVLAHVAKGCDKYGTDVTHRPLGVDATPEFKVGMDVDSGQPDAEQGIVSNCRTCANFVDASLVQQETGWTGSICRATGNLMPDSRLNKYSAKCGKYRRQVGIRPPAHVRLKSFTFFPQYDKFFGEVNLAQSYRDNVTSNFVDPREFPNERPLTPGLEAMMLRRGIRAWRRIVDPAGYGEDVFLPIYNADAMIPAAPGSSQMVPFLTDHEKSLIPKTGDRERPELYADHGQLLYTMAVLWMKLDETPAWWGQGGTGKTEFARHLAWLMHSPFHRINITGSSETDDIAGKMLFEKNETKFHYGRLPAAWKRPGIILLDEPNTGQPEIWQLIRPLMDNSQELALDQNKGEKVRRHDDCFFTLAMNPAWDPRNVGTQSIGDADASRMMHIFFSLPPEDLEIEIIQQRVKGDGWEVPAHQIKALMKVAKELRAASDDGILHSTWGLRHQIQTARALKWFPPLTAYKRAVGDYLEPNQFEVIHTIVKSHFGE